MFFVRVRLGKKSVCCFAFSATLLPQDINCLVSFLRSELWGFAACQSVIFIVCAFFQVRTLCSQNLQKELEDSFTVGIPTNAVLKMLLEEKTFEAPLSLFLQSLGQSKKCVLFAAAGCSLTLSTYLYNICAPHCLVGTNPLKSFIPELDHMLIFNNIHINNCHQIVHPPFLRYFSSFWVMKDDFSFASLWMSMFFSVLGISGGFYTASHLSIIDLEDLEDEIELTMASKDLAPQAIGQASSSYPDMHPGPDSPAKALNLPPPPGLGPAQNLPPPPGLDPQPQGHRRAGQFASATE